jgi:hypothetical protein
LIVDRLAVATHVAVPAPDNEHDRLAVADVLHLAVCRGIDTRDAARGQGVCRAITEAELDRAGTHKVGLLLVVVEVRAGRIPGGEHDRVDSKRGHAELATDLAKAGSIAHLVQARDGVSLCSRRLGHGGDEWYLSGAAEPAATDRERAY